MSARRARRLRPCARLATWRGSSRSVDPRHPRWVTSMTNPNRAGGHGYGESAGGANSQGSESAYHRLGVAATAAAIRRGGISAEAYAGALLSRARQNADLNAFITIDETAVLTAARAADKARAQ